jgi:hypothetical protein
VVGELLDHCLRQGVRPEDDRLEQASTWDFDPEAGAIVSASYIGPPT